MLRKEGEPESGSTPPNETDDARQARWNEENAKTMERYQASRGLWGNIRSLPGIGRLLRIR